MATTVKDKRFRIDAALSGLAYVAGLYHNIDPEGEDADDFLETMIVIESFLDNGGVNHRDLVARFRRGRQTRINGKETMSGGNRDERSQMYKLQQSKDPFYISRSGFTNGAAMRSMATAFFFPALDEMVYATNFVASITHESPESRAAAIALAIAYRLALTKDEWSVEEVAAILGSYIPNGSNARHYFDLSFSGNEYHKPSSLLELTERYGYMHAAISSVPAAIHAAKASWSLTPVEEFFRYPPSRQHQVVGVDDDKTTEKFIHYLATACTRGMTKRHDADTYYSMLIPLAMMDEKQHNTKIYSHQVFERFDNIAEALAARWP